jgi:hypothetical protein
MRLLDGRLSLRKRLSQTDEDGWLSREVVAAMKIA